MLFCFFAFSLCCLGTTAAIQAYAYGAGNLCAHVSVAIAHIHVKSRKIIVSLVAGPDDIENCEGAQRCHVNDRLALPKATTTRTPHDVRRRRRRRRRRATTTTTTATTTTKTTRQHDGTRRCDSHQFQTAFRNFLELLDCELYLQ